MRARSQNAFASIQTEGAILPADLLRRIAEGDGSLGGLDPGSYHLAGREKLSEAVSRSWSRLLGAWAAFKGARERLPASDAGTSLTREKWLLPLFQELGYGRLLTTKPIVIGEKSYAISHAWSSTPIHLVSFRVDLDRRQPGATGASRSSPHSLVQELLNRSPEHLWGIASNGLRLRVLRDNASLARQAFVEFDLEAMFDGELYSDFVLIWLLCHQSRVEGDRPDECWLEKWSKAAKAQGTRALDRLRTGVEATISVLGIGFLTHPANRTLRERLQTGEVSPQTYYRELLRHVYRLLFLFVAEDRELLHAAESDPASRSRYSRFFSTQRLRRIALRLRGSRHGDLFAALRLVFSHLANGGCSTLGLPAFGGLLFSSEAVPETGDCALANRDLLQAVRALAFTEDAGVRRTTDYRNLGAEELGSVYESLLDLHPEINVPAGRFELKHSGAERRATGSHYTATNVLKPGLDFALDPAIEECLKQLDPVEALLSLRVLDLSCGSGHFLIAAAQRIARRVAALRTGDEEPAPDAVRHAIRDVVARCIYGVDVNPMAVELCKVALWMETLEPGKPLGFLDHRIRCGDSLLGVPLTTTVTRMKREIEERRARTEEDILAIDADLRNVPYKGEAAERLAKKRKALEKERNALEYDVWPDHVPDEAFKATGDDDKTLVRATVAENRKERRAGQRTLFRGNLLEVAKSAEVLAGLASAEESVAEVQAKAQSLRDLEASATYRTAKLRADAWCAAFFWRIDRDQPPAPTDAIFQFLKEAPERLDPAIRARIDQIAAQYKFFHFELAFPEVFTGERPGFDVEVGNPPYLGGKKISTNLGDRYLHFLKVLTPESADTTDLSAYFFRRAFDLLAEGGNLGFLATNTIAQGDTRAAALTPITQRWGGMIANAIRSMPWEGVANLEVAVVHVHKGVWAGRRTLDGRKVSQVTSMLDDGAAGSGESRRLRSNADLAFIGTVVLGTGFVVTPEEAAELIERDPRNQNVLFPYLNGEDLNSRPDQSPSRCVINFFDWPLNRETAPQGYEGPVAEDYPDCLEIVRTRVKPDRDTLRDTPDGRRYKRWWWRFGRSSASLHRASRESRYVLGRARVANLNSWEEFSTGTIPSEAVVVVAMAAPEVFAVLQSAIHDFWLRMHASSMRTDIRYGPSDCFETYPFPRPGDAERRHLGDIGARYATHRRLTCLNRRLGLTRIYNHLHDPQTERDDSAIQKLSPPFEDFRRLRTLHVEMDLAVLAAYGWGDIEPRHGFYRGREAGTGVDDKDYRFTLHPDARAEILRRLLALNLERASEEDAMIERGEPISSAFSWFESESPTGLSTVEMGADLADAGWATPSGATEDAVAMFALLDVMQLLSSPADPERVRLAALLTRKPVLALPFVDDDTKDQWMRAVGREARPLPENVVPLSRYQKGGTDVAWAEAVRQLKGSGRLVEDRASGLWSAGTDWPESGQAWIRGRASVAVEVLRAIDLAKAEQNLVTFEAELRRGATGEAVS